jgi:hypothetical protein
VLTALTAPTELAAGGWKEEEEKKAEGLHVNG